MKLKYTRLLSAMIISAISLTSCKKYLDVNDSPNGPKNASDVVVLPSTQGGVGMVVGSNMQIFGGMWSQYWTQNTTNAQYKSIDQYQPAPADFNRMWGILYNVTLEDIQFLLTSKSDQYVAIALLEKAYCFQLLTDAFGDVPLKDALKGGDNLYPKYDSQKEVYDSIISWAKKGVSLANNSSASKPGKEDMIFGGNMDNWKKFGNTLLLKAYLRLAYVDAAKAQQSIADLYATSPAFLSTDVKITYNSVGGNQNPLYAEGAALNTQNLIASKTTVDALSTNSDPRAQYFYLPRTTGGVIVGNPQGQYNVTQTVCGYPSPNVGGRVGNIASASAPVILMSAAESYFLQAEAVTRGWASGNVTTLFNNGITASFTSCSMPTSASAYISSAVDAQLPADTEGKLNAIITQKYYAMCGTQGFEAWTEWRRTGYPTFLVVSKASQLTGTDKPRRFLYPDTEVTRNANFPGQKLITDKVWWDVK